MTEKRKHTLSEIMARPLPPITPSEEAELKEVEKFFDTKFPDHPGKKTLTEIMARPLSPITPEEEAELKALEDLFDAGAKRHKS
ncbi:hypothetical protein NIES25_48530 [Nostoc linckia NIES-25]|nr:hypothetical protein NIES25_48530 [Nostoc linckia NIES-25]